MVITISYGLFLITYIFEISTYVGLAEKLLLSIKNKQKKVTVHNLYKILIDY